MQPVVCGQYNIFMRILATVSVMPGGHGLLAAVAKAAGKA
jgi:hypothetical protein